MLLHVREPRTPADLNWWNGEVDRFLKGAWSAPLAASRRRNFVFSVVPDAEGVTLTANVPGLDASAITITAEGPTLTISGSRPAETREGSYRLRERAFGDFSHSFHLSEDLDSAAIAASCKDGVLSVRIPKRAKVEPRTIAVKVAS